MFAGIGRHVALDISTKGLMMVVADRDRIRHVLDNLVLNALRHSPGETAITMEARHPGKGHSRDQIRKEPWQVKQV